MERGWAQRWHRPWRRVTPRAEVDDGLQERTGNMEPMPPAQVGKRRG